MTHGMRQRRGSALLVVLGMVSFLVISAVAFSAYMRYSRLPSSFLRQTVASRLLAKAALANAIDEIDAAIGNNPHPGRGNAAYTFPRGDGVSARRNYWRGRVYTGTNDVNGISMSDTVSPLSFEALAYVPPPLVNEVRYYSRRSTAAKWRGLGFNSGRYIFCAVDVSDYFDVNATLPDVPRSSDPESKISLSYLFENPTSGGNAGFCTPDEWAAVMEEVRSSRVPLISMADWNLAMQDKSPFVRYVGRTAEDGTFYGGEDLDKIRRMTFVTDGYFPRTAAGTTVYDLADDQYQPWTEAQLQNWSPSACEAVANGSSPTLMRLAEHFPFAVSAALYDYLDKDRVPCSLALPTVERAPMICGIEVVFGGGTLAVKDMIPEAQKYAYNPTDYLNSPSRETTKKLQFNLDPDRLQLANIQVSALATYPFRHEDGIASENYTVDGVLLLFLTSDAMGLRPDSASARLREAMEGNGQIYKTASVKDGVISLPISGSTGFGGEIKTQEAAVQPITLSVDVGSVPGDLANADNALLSAVLKVTQTADPIDPSDLTRGYNWANPKPANEKIEDYPQATVESAECKFRPFAPNGAEDAAYAKTGNDLFPLYRTGGADLRLNVAVVLRVRNRDDKVVDMVPATGVCDEVFNRAQNGSGLARDCIVRVSGDWAVGTPLMRLDTGATVKWGKQGFDASIASPAAITISPAVTFIGDPRFNYAPESWFSYGGSCSKENWLNECGAKDADGDIFLQTSDQCRLQSVFELANLPRIGEVDANGTLFAGADNSRGAMREPESVNRKTIGSKADALNREFMWKTYDPLGRYVDDGDDFESLDIISDGGGFKVNPYSDSTNVLMAAFANTPHDWRCAYYDNKEINNLSMMAADYNRKYAWNEFSSGAKIRWTDLEAVAGKFMNAMPNDEFTSDDAAFAPWKDALFNIFHDNLSNDRVNFNLCGINLQDDDVFNTDRKFLYGFWHECFSSRQQLFLIFVRAEPVMMGGGAIGQTPPQLGARAVALVWRDPAAKNNDANSVAPHRTRILFYRQFE